MSTINIGGQEVPAIAIAVALPVLAMLYLADAAYFGYVFSPTLLSVQEDIQAREAKVQELRDKAANLKVKAKDYDKIKKEIVEVEKAIELLKSKIPAEAQVPILLYDIVQMTESRQCSLDSFTPGPLAEFGKTAGAVAGQKENKIGNDIMEMPVTIQAAATYGQVIKLMDNLNQYERTLNISGLSLSPDTANTRNVSNDRDPSKPSFVFKNKLKIEFTLMAYVLKQKGGESP